MTKEEKNVTLAELKEEFSTKTTFYLADTSNLSVANINKLRRLCFKAGVQIRIAKNTLIRKALEANNVTDAELLNALHGPTSIWFSEVANAPAKVIKEFRKTNEKPILKAAYIETAIFIGDTQIDSLASLKSKNELIGEIIGLLQSPAKNVVSALKSSGSKLAGILKTLENRTN